MNEKIDKKYIVPGVLLHQVLNYLKTKPWQEVENIMHVLLNLKEIKKEENKKKQEVN